MIIFQAAFKIVEEGCKVMNEKESENVRLARSRTFSRVHALAGDGRRQIRELVVSKRKRLSKKYTRAREEHRALKVTA